MPSGSATSPASRATPAPSPNAALTNRSGKESRYLLIVILLALGLSDLDGLVGHRQKFFDDDLVDVLAADASLPVRRSDGSKPLTQVCLQRRRVVGTDEREDLLVPFPHGHGKRGLEQPCGNTLSPTVEIDVGSEH